VALSPQMSNESLFLLRKIFRDSLNLKDIEYRLNYAKRFIPMIF
jgi:hypothetical protein